MSHSTRRVSLGMPVYNGERFLRQSLDSLLAQTFEDFELIISDNASTDRTEEICRAYAAKDRRIRFYRNETNVGAAENYNRVFELSQGEYFKWATYDDLCAPAYLTRCVEILDCHPSVVLAYPRTKIINEHGELIADYDDGLHLQSESVVYRFRQLSRALAECNAVFGLIRANILRQTPLIGKYIGADVCLLAELSLYGKFWEISDFLFFRREHAASSSSDKSTEKQMEFFDPRVKARIFLPEWRHHFEHLLSVKRVPLSLTEKVRLVLLLSRSGVWKRKKLVEELFEAAKQIFFRRAIS